MNGIEILSLERRFKLRAEVQLLYYNMRLRLERDDQLNKLFAVDGAEGTKQE